MLNIYTSGRYIAIEKFLINQIGIIDKEVSAIEKEISALPNGEIKVYPNNDSFRCYLIEEVGRRYLSKKDIKLSEDLAYKKFLQLKKNALIEKRENIILRQEEKYTELGIFQDFLKHKWYGMLIAKRNIEKYTEDESWGTKDYKKNSKYKEQLTFQCPSGNFVRSKSEVFIDMALTQNGISFRYECELILGKNIFYPDFTIKHPLTGDVIYWEHFGRMDDHEYARNAYNKLKLFYECGIVPGKNLIITFETKQRPFSYFDAEVAVKMI